MMRSKKFAIFVLPLLIAPSLAAAQAYKFKTIDYGSTSASLHGVNVHGVIAGDYIDANGVLNCFLVTGSKQTPISDPKGATTFCSDIDKSGVVVGGYTVGSNYVGYTYAAGTFTDVPGPAGSTYSLAYGINDHGVLIGTYVDAANTQHGFLLKGGKYTSFDAPGATFTIGDDVDNAGDYTEQGFPAQGTARSYLVSGGTTIELKFPGSTVTRVHALNNKGQVALAWTDSAGNIHGGVYGIKTKAYTQIDVPKAVSTGVLGIDDKQTLVGYYILADGSQHGFEATGHVP